MVGSPCELVVYDEPYFTRSAAKMSCPRGPKRAGTVNLFFFLILYKYSGTDGHSHSNSCGGRHIRPITRYFARSDITCRIYDLASVCVCKVSKKMPLLLSVRSSGLSRKTRIWANTGHAWGHIAVVKVLTFFSFVEDCILWTRHVRFPINVTDLSPQSHLMTKY